MKKSTKITLGAIAAVSALYVGGIAPVAMPSGIVGEVYATNIEDKEDTEVSGLHFISFEQAFSTAYKGAEVKKTDNVYTATINVTIDNSFLEHILKQTPGDTDNEAPLSHFFVGIKADGDYTSMGATTIAKGSSLTDAVKSSIEVSEDTSGFNTLWISGAKVEYYKDGKWQTSTRTGRGDKTIKAELCESLGKGTECELNYGADYRVSLNDNTDFVLKWSKEEGDVYARISFNAKFAITSTVTGDSNKYFTSLEDAIAYGAKSIVINDNVVTSDYEPKYPNDVKTITIPEGTTLEIASGKTLTLGENVKLANKGTIKATKGQIVNSENVSVYNTVTKKTEKVDGTESSETSKPMLAGEEIIIDLPTAPEGYSVKMAIDGSYALTSNHYYMDAGNGVTITYTFVETKDAGTVTEGSVADITDEDTDIEVGTTNVDKLVEQIAKTDEVKDLLTISDTVDVNLYARKMAETEAEYNLAYLAETTKFNDALKKIGATVEDIEGLFEISVQATAIDADGGYHYKTIRELGEDNAVTLAIKLPEDRTDSDKFYIIRIHRSADGLHIESVDIIDPNTEDGLAVFENDKFSTFLLARVDGTTIPGEDEDEDGDIVIDGPIDEGEDEDEAGVGNQGAFTNLEKSSTETTNSSSLVAAIAAVIAVAIASVSKLFKKGEQEQ